MCHDGWPYLKQITVMSKTCDVQYVGGSQITCVNQYLSNPVITLRPHIKCFVCVFHQMQSESAAGAHFNTGILFRGHTGLLVFINNNAWGHQVSVSRDHVRRKYNCCFFMFYVAVII